MDGYQSTREIRLFEQSRDVDPCWIIALSAHAAGDYVQKARDAGVDDYLSKPVSRSQVLEALQRNRALSAGGDCPALRQRPDPSGPPSGIHPDRHLGALSEAARRAVPVRLRR